MSYMEQSKVLCQDHASPTELGSSLAQKPSFRNTFLFLSLPATQYSPLTAAAAQDASQMFPLRHTCGCKQRWSMFVTEDPE